jgi:hypothetical protein
MGEPGPSSKPDTLPEWFLQYVQEQQNKAAAAQENERLQAADREKQAMEARSRMIRNNNKPGKALPSLLEYYGEADKLEAWLQQARAKMEVDYYGCTEFVKFWALNGVLRGKALRRMEAWVREQGTAELANSYAFLDRVGFVFRDPQAKERAQRKLDALRQGSKPFLEVFTEWQSLLLESGGSSWPDDAKKVSLDRILSDDLVRAMITVPSQPDFESYCSILKETDDRLRAYKARTKQKDTEVTKAPRQTTWKRPADTVRPVTDEKNAYKPELVRKASVEDMEWEPTPAKVATANSRRAKWVSQEVRDQRRRTGLCIRCGGSGHIVRECPYGQPQRPVASDSVRKETAKARVVEPELEDEEPQSSESEN